MHHAAQPPDATCEIEKINDAAFTTWRYGIFPAPHKTIGLPRGGNANYAT